MAERNIALWKKNLSKMDEEYEKYASPKENPMPAKEEQIAIKDNVKIVNIKKPQDKPVFSKKEIRVLLFATKIITDYNKAVDNIKRRKTIVKIDPNKIIKNNNSTLSYLEKALSSADENGLHIYSIIENMEKLGWQSKSKYYKCAQIYSVIHNNSYMFHKVKKATFKLREGFFKTQTVINKPKETTKQVGNNIPTMKTIIGEIVSKSKNKNKLSTFSVYQKLIMSGFDISYQHTCNVLNKLNVKSSNTKNT